MIWYGLMLYDMNMMHDMINDMMRWDVACYSMIRYDMMFLI